jgi:hypothetical protein
MFAQVGYGCVHAADDAPSAPTEAAPAPAQPAAAAPPAAPAASGAWEGPDESQETTSLQLRLADGSRMVRTWPLSADLPRTCLLLG